MRRGAEASLAVLAEFFNNLCFAQYRDYKYIQWAERDDGDATTRIGDRARQRGVHIICYDPPFPRVGSARDAERPS